MKFELLRVLPLYLKLLISDSQFSGFEKSFCIKNSASQVKYFTF